MKYLFTIIITLSLLILMSIGGSYFYYWKTQIGEKLWVQNINWKIRYWEIFPTEVYCCVDPKTITHIWWDFYTDSENIYYFHEISSAFGSHLEFDAQKLNIDRWSIRYISNSIIGDKNNVYWISYIATHWSRGPFSEIKMIGWADPQSFTILHEFEDIAKDKNAIYIKRYNQRIWLTDWKRNVSYVDRWKDTYVPSREINTEYDIDKWEKTHEFSPIDIESFELIDRKSAKDKNNKYKIGDDGYLFVE